MGGLLGWVLWIKGALLGWLLQVLRQLPSLDAATVGLFTCMFWIWSYLIASL